MLSIIHQEIFSCVQVHKKRQTSSSGSFANGLMLSANGM